VSDVVELVQGDGLEALADERNVAFCFLDVESHLVAKCQELVVPNLVLGGLLGADNAINRRSTPGTLIERATADGGVDAVEIPIGMRELVVREA
jgi:predicted O-methyltransferase YrrM